MIPCRPYQLAGVEQIRNEIRAGSKRVLFVLATGGGKTVVASHIVASAVARGKRVLFVAHRRELINQAYAKLVANGLAENDVGVIMSGDKRRRPGAPVQVASIDTLRTKAKPIADLVIIDEAHRSLAKSYRDLVEQYPAAVVLGLTATPYRADGKGLGEMYSALVVIATPRVLIAEGFLVEPRVYTVPSAKLPDLSSVKVSGGDYDETELAAAVDRVGLVGDIVEHWQRHAGGVRTVAFAVSVQHSQHIAEQFRAAGIAAEHLDGATTTADRDAILARLQSGETLVVSNCGVLCEGWDQPSVKCCILARPTKSTGLYLQQAGRILRPWQDTPATILDHAGCAIEHGLPQDDREYTLDAAKKRKKGAENEAPCRTCPACFMVLPVTAKVCPGCGFEFIAEARVLDEIDGQLVEVRPATIEEKREEWDRLCALALQRGYQRGWIFHRYKEKFGTKPPSEFPLPAIAAREYTEAEKATELAQLRALRVQKGYRVEWVAIRYRAKFGEEIPTAKAQPAAAATVEEVVEWAL